MVIFTIVRVYTKFTEKKGKKEYGQMWDKNKLSQIFSLHSLIRRSGISTQQTRVNHELCQN